MSVIRWWAGSVQFVSEPFFAENSCLASGNNADENDERE